MIVKVCGLKFNQNIIDISALNIDMVGYNFYESSPRYVQDTLPEIRHHIKKVGIFVNSSATYINQKTLDYKLDLVQLHGDESITFCKQIQRSIPIIKVFRVDENFNAQNLRGYEFCDFFLFDTASKQYGGSGLKFNWSILEDIKTNVPFLISGGIGFEDLDTILKFDHPKFVGIDINSKFELSPGLKDVSLINAFLQKLKI